MTIAETLEKDFNSLERDESGFVIENQYFRNQVESFAESIELDCPDSSDSAWNIVFKDGSIGFYTNPHQEAFSAEFYEL